MNNSIFLEFLSVVYSEKLHKISSNFAFFKKLGEIETVKHYICDCELYEMERQSLLTHLFYETGEQSLNKETFLTLEKEHRESLLMLLNDFIISTKRFLQQ